MTRGIDRRAIARVAVVLLSVLVVGGCGLSPVNRAPVASLSASPEDGYRPLDVTFDASQSADPDGDTLTYRWSFGDGMTGAGVTTTYTYDIAGSYDVVLRVSDPDGGEDATMITIEVEELPEGYVVLAFSWSWEGTSYTLEFPIVWSLYLAYRGRLRSALVDNYDYGAFVADPLDDPTLGDLAVALRRRAGSDDVAYAGLALAFVQDVVDYAPDPPDVEWPLYPIETLVDAEGDCEDAAILYVSLLKAAGIGCQLAFVDTNEDGMPDHVLALVEVPESFAPDEATVFELEGTRYAVAETSSGSQDLGADPWGLEVDDLIERWPF